MTYKAFEVRIWLFILIYVAYLHSGDKITYVGMFYLIGVIKKPKWYPNEFC
jgi:hypothetical protein